MVASQRWRCACAVLACLVLIAADCRMLAGDDFFEKVITRVGKDDFRKLEEIAGKIFDGPDVAIELTPELAGELSRTEAGLQNSDGKAVFHRMLANHARASRDPAREIREYTAVMEEFPETLVAPECAESLMVRAEQLSDFATMRSAAAFVGRFADSAEKRRDVARVTAFALVGLGEYDAAVKHVETVACTEGPSAWLRELFNNVAVRLMKADQLEAAEHLLMAAYESSPPDERDLGLLGSLSNLARIQGRIEDVIRYQEETKQRTSEPAMIPEIDFSIAGNLLKLERFDDARARYQAVLDAPGDSEDLSRLKRLAEENIQNIAALTAPQSVPGEIPPELSRSPGTAWWMIVGGAALVIVILAGWAWNRHRKETR